MTWLTTLATVLIASTAMTGACMMAYRKGLADGQRRNHGSTR